MQHPYHGLLDLRIPVMGMFLADLPQATQRIRLTNIAAAVVGTDVTVTAKSTGDLQAVNALYGIEYTITTVGL